MYLITSVPEDITKKLDEVINKKHTEKANHDLAGNIQKEFMIPEGKPIVWPLIDKCIQAHFDKFPTYYARISGMHKSDEFHLELHSLWVNYQKKYEFNPFHNHSGIISFIIFGKIPFRMSDEHKVSPGVVAEKNLSGVLQFFYLSTNFKEPIKTREFFIDQSWEGKGLMFFSNLNHLVYPFFSSDDYRITFSGNIFLKHE